MKCNAEHLATINTASEHVSIFLFQFHNIIIIEQNYISDVVFEKIKDFKCYKLTEQQLLINKPNKELKQHYKLYGFCEGCKQLNIDSTWC